MSWRTSAQQAEWVASGRQHGRQVLSPATTTLVCDHTHLKHTLYLLLVALPNLLVPVCLIVKWCAHFFSHLFLNIPSFFFHSPHFFFAFFFLTFFLKRTGGFAVGGDVHSTNERLQKLIEAKQTLIDQMLQAEEVRSRKTEDERRELASLRGQVSDWSNRESRLKSQHQAALASLNFDTQQLKTQLSAKDARVDSMRQAHADATQQLNMRMMEVTITSTKFTPHLTQILT